MFTKHFIKHLITLCACIIFVISCDKNHGEINDFISKKDKNFGNITLSKVRTIALESSYNSSIGAPLYSVEFNSRGDMYFFDTIKNNFLVYKENGEFIESFGRTGRGPLEFQLVYGYTVDAENNLYVYDDAQRQIKMFDNEFQLLQILDVDNTQFFISSHDIKVVNDEVFFGIIDAMVVGSDWDNKQLIQSPPIMIAKIDTLSSTKFVGTYDPYLNTINSVYNRPLFDIDTEKNTILVSHQNSYRFQEYDLKDRKRVAYFGYKDITFGEGLAKTRKGESKQSRISKTMSESSNEKVFYTNNFIGSFYINGTEKWFDSRDLSDLRYYLAIYSRDEYELKSVFSIDHRLIGVYKDELYFIENEDPDHFQIGIYELTNLE